MFRKHLIYSCSLIKEALLQLDKLGSDAILFVVEKNNKLLGALTDGDIRRGLINDFRLDDPIDLIIQKDPKFIYKSENNLKNVIEYRDGNYRIVPVLDDEHRVINIINFREVRSYLPVEAVIMAGGRGERLRPLTDTTPKPLLKVGDKPIIEHNINRLILFGIDDLWISIGYLGNLIKEYLGNGKGKNVSIEYITENERLGTIGAVRKIPDFKHDYILVTNSDILTNLDYEDFFTDFIENEADISVVTVSYKVSVPYAVLEINERDILDFKEKPTYTYYSNAGIYLIKKELIDLIPGDRFYDATDLLKKVIDLKKKVIYYPLRGYWLDIGREEDYKKAQEDIDHIKF